MTLEEALEHGYGVAKKRTSDGNVYRVGRVNSLRVELDHRCWFIKILEENATYGRVKEWYDEDGWEPGL